VGLTAPLTALLAVWGLLTLYVAVTGKLGRSVLG
jgi:hypothetical protein